MVGNETAKYIGLQCTRSKPTTCTKPRWAGGRSRSRTTPNFGRHLTRPDVTSVQSCILEPRPSGAFALLLARAHAQLFRTFI